MHHVAAGAVGLAQDLRILLRVVVEPPQGWMAVRSWGEDGQVHVQLHVVCTRMAVHMLAASPALVQFRNLVKPMAMLTLVCQRLWFVDELLADPVKAEARSREWCSPGYESSHAAAVRSPWPAGQRPGRAR